MILTDRFVFIHLPKTGGTFVTSVLERLLKPPPARSWFERSLRRLRGRPYRDRMKHGTCNDVPDSHRGLPLVACIRSPYERYASGYDFGWWRDRPPRWADMEAVRREFPRFPEVSFGEYVEIACRHFPRLRGAALPPEERPGFFTEVFVRTFFRDPAAAWQRIDDAYLAAKGWTADMHPVRFLRTESLNRDLHAFLLEQGFPPDRVAFVLEEAPILPGGAARPRTRPWREYYTPELMARVRRRDRLLFAMFPEYDVPAAAP